MNTIYVSDLKRKLKNPLVLINYILLPLLLIIILGNALSSTFKTKSSEIKKIDLITISNNGSSAYNDSLKNFFESQKNFNIKNSSNISNARKEIAKNSNKTPVIVQVKDSEKANKPRLNLVATDQAISELSLVDLYASTFNDGLQVTSVTGRNIFNYKSHFKKNNENKENKEAKNVSGITYYGVTMLVLILFYGLSNSMGLIKEEYDGPFGTRLLITPVKKSSLILGHVFSGTTLSILQSLIIILIAKTFLKVNYGPGPAYIFIVVIAALFFNSLGVLAGVIARKRPNIDMVITLLIPLMTFVSGGFVKLDFGELSSLSVNTIFQNMFFSFIENGVLDSKQLVNIFNSSVIILLISMFLLTKKRGYR
jgi:ABC-2 type transport system permease protein